MNENPVRSAPPDARPETLLSKSGIIHCLFIALVCCLAYANTFHVPFQFDDFYSILGKPFVRDIRLFFGGGAVRFMSDHAFRMRPVGYFTFALNYWLGGADVTGYHVVNLVIHILNGFLVYWLVVLSFRGPVLEGSSLRGSSRLIALFSALLFVSHPVQTEAVTYIVQRLASLAALFYLLSLASYVRWRLSSGVGPAAGWKTLHWYALSLVSAVLAMKTKETAFTLPVTIALYEFLFFTGGLRKRVAYLVPLLLTMLIIPVGLIGANTPLGEMIGEVEKVTTVGHIPRSTYLFTEFRVMMTYLRLLFLPVNQNLDYDYPLYYSFFDPPVILSFLFLAALLGAGLYLLYRDIKRPSVKRLISFGVFWFFIALSVESSVIPIKDVIFEHRLYLPSVGFIIALTVSLFIVAGRLKSAYPAIMKSTIYALAGIILAFSALTYARNEVWQSGVSLWKDVIQKSPSKARAYKCLGLAYQGKGMYGKAIEEYTKAISLDPYYADIFNNLGSAYHYEGVYGRAIEAYTRAISLYPADSSYYNNRGLSYAAAGEYEPAARDYLKAISIDPYYAEAFHNLGAVYHIQGRYDEAIAEYTRAILLAPNNYIFYGNRGLSYASSGEFNRAVEDYSKAIALAPDFVGAYNGRGTAFAQSGRLDEAIADFSRAIILRPEIGSYYTNRGTAFAMEGRMGQAAQDFGRACEKGDDRGCRRLEELQKR